MKTPALLASAALVTAAAVAFSQGPPRMRTHSVVTRGTLRPVPATQSPPAESEVSITVEGRDRVIRGNGVPAHAVGRFPNRGNPNAIRVQRHEYRVPADPKPAAAPTSMRGEFGWDPLESTCRHASLSIL